MLLAAKLWPPKMEIFLYFEIGLAIGIRRILVRPIGQWLPEMMRLVNPHE